MNLIVVDKCTNYCAYCFASNEMAKNGRRSELSREGVEEVVSFVARSGPQFHLNIIGGEPFLYGDLEFLLERLCSESAFGTATIFTGGIFAARALDRIARFGDRLALLVNLNERRDYERPADYAVVLRNVGHALDLGIRLNIGFNIWREDFDYDEILGACRRFGVEHLRWTVAYPEAKTMPGVSVLHPSAYQGVARRCAAFLDAAYQAKVCAYLDCPLPKCFFTAAELGRILLTQPHSATVIRSCGPVIDVTPDLTVFRCYALSGEHRRKLGEFRNFQELTAWYQQAIDDRYERPQVYDACNTCEFAEDRSCYGGCMANSVASLGQRPSTEELMRSAHTALRAGRTQEAEAALDRLPRQDAAVALLRAHISLRRGDREDAVRWARVAVNRSRTAAMRQQALKLLTVPTGNAIEPEERLTVNITSSDSGGACCVPSSKEDMLLQIGTHAVSHAGTCNGESRKKP